MGGLRIFKIANLMKYYLFLSEIFLGDYIHIKPPMSQFTQKLKSNHKSSNRFPESSSILSEFVDLTTGFKSLTKKKVKSEFIPFM